MTKRDDERTTREYDLLETATELRSRLQGDVHRHLYHGFTQRLQMIQAGRLHLLESADGKDQTPRGVYMATELSLQANAYYLNIRGALDNLAWMLQYHWALLPGTTELSGRKVAIYLFGNDFLEDLNLQHPALAATLRSHVGWAQDLSNRRDPAAHRIPLQVPRTVFSEDDVLTMRQIEAEANELFAAKKPLDAMALLRGIDRLGTFEPVLLQSTSSGPVPVHLHTHIGEDHDRILTVSEEVLDYLAATV